MVFPSIFKPFNMPRPSVNNFKTTPFCNLKNFVTLSQPYFHVKGPYDTCSIL